jgi:hypothetical protein
MAAPTPKTQIVNGKEYLSCMNIYDLHSFCISFRSQLNQVRRFGRMQACGELFYDWKKCMTAKVRHIYIRGISKGFRGCIPVFFLPFLFPESLSCTALPG